MKKLPKARLIFLLLCCLPHGWPWLMSIIYQCHFSRTVLHQLWQSLFSGSVLSSFSLHLVFYFLSLSCPPALSYLPSVAGLSLISHLSPPAFVCPRQASRCLHRHIHSSSELLQKYLRANGETNGLCRMCVYPPWRIIQRRSFQALC